MSALNILPCPRHVPSPQTKLNKNMSDSSKPQGLNLLSNFRINAPGMPFLSAHMGFPRGSYGKESACNTGDPGLMTCTLSSFRFHLHSWEAQFYLYWNSWICSSMKTDYPFLQMDTVNFYLWILNQWILMLGILSYSLLFKYYLLANLIYFHSIHC